MGLKSRLDELNACLLSAGVAANLRLRRLLNHSPGGIDEGASAARAVFVNDVSLEFPMKSWFRMGKNFF